MGSITSGWAGSHAAWCPPALMTLKVHAAACCGHRGAATVRDGRLPAWCFVRAGSPARQGFLLRGCIASCCRYMKQTQRWRDYAKLFTFLGFVALFLSVLYLQRGAQTAYEVRLGIQVD